MKRERACRVHYCLSYMGCRFNMILGYTFVFGVIGLRRKTFKKFKNLGFSSLTHAVSVPCPYTSLFLALFAYQQNSVIISYS